MRPFLMAVFWVLAFALVAALFCGVAIPRQWTFGLCGVGMLLLGWQMWAETPSSTRTPCWPSWRRHKGLAMPSKEPAKSGYEQDWTTAWRKVLHFNAGIGKYIKRCLNKRARRHGKKAMLAELAKEKASED